MLNYNKTKQKVGLRPLFISINPTLILQIAALIASIPDKVSKEKTFHFASKFLQVPDYFQIRPSTLFKSNSL